MAAKSVKPGGESGSGREHALADPDPDPGLVSGNVGAWRSPALSSHASLTAGSAAGDAAPEGRLLARVHEAGRRGLPQGEAARALGVSQAALSRLCGRLERRGLIAREAHWTDRRIKVVKLTAEGLSRLAPWPGPRALADGALPDCALG